METFVAVIFGMIFGAIVTAGFTMTKKPKTPTKTGGGGGSIHIDNQEVKENNDNFEQAQ